VHRIPNIYFSFHVGNKAGDLAFKKTDLLIVLAGTRIHFGAEADGTEGKGARLL
jgi:hypothetical protein